MAQFQVDFTDSNTGATSAIDTITAADNYTADDYIRDCENNANNDYVNMIKSGEITLVKID